MEGNACVWWCGRENTPGMKASNTGCKEEARLGITGAKRVVLDIGALHGQDRGSTAWQGAISPLPKASSPTCQGIPALHPAQILSELHPDPYVQLQLDAHPLTHTSHLPGRPTVCPFAHGRWSVSILYSFSFDPIS